MERITATICASVLLLGCGNGTDGNEPWDVGGKAEVLEVPDLSTAPDPGHPSPVDGGESPPDEIEAASDNPAAVQTGGHTFLAMYVVGTDYEDDIAPPNDVPDELEHRDLSGYGHASDNLREVVRGWTALTPLERQGLGIAVAFGGARKYGWQGIKLADADCLVKDAIDDYFGNDDCYTWALSNGNMSDPQVFAAFLSEAMEQAAGYDRSALFMWDHGGAYQGLCIDANTHKADFLELPELQSAFSTADARFDIIVLDACLMACMEVAEVLKPYADYLVASEETESVFCNDLIRFVEFVGGNPNASVEDQATRLVDLYMDGWSVFTDWDLGEAYEVSHWALHPSTMSVLRLSEVDGTIGKLNALLSGLMDFDDEFHYWVALEAFLSAERYGIEPDPSRVASADLKGFAEAVGDLEPGLKTQAEALTVAIDDLVLYERHDGYRPGSNGVAIFTPEARLFWFNFLSLFKYKQGFYLSQTWMVFLNKFFSLGLSDDESPVFEGDERSADGRRRMNWHDDRGIARLFSGHGEHLGGGVYRLWRTEPTTRLHVAASLLGPGADYIVETDPWDGRGLLICDGPCGKETGQMVPAYHESGTEERRVYSLEAELLGGKENGSMGVALRIRMDGDTVVDVWMSPRRTKPVSGTMLRSRARLEIQPGMRLRFRPLGVDTSVSPARLVRLPPMEIAWERKPDWTWTPLEFPGSSRFEMVVAADLNGNAEASDPRIVRFTPAP